MDSLPNPPPLFCLTASGTLIYQGKVLLVKHKKLGFWLAPGGHMEPGEHPHEAAVREFWEEAGVKVRAVTAVGPDLGGEADMGFLPVPYAVNLHWISDYNYQVRTGQMASSKPIAGYKQCEQHYNMNFLVEPVDSNHVDFSAQIEEVDGIRWFSKSEVPHLETNDAIKTELMMAFGLAGVE